MQAASADKRGMNSASESSDGNAGCGDPLPHASKARDGKDVLFECRVVDITELEFSLLLSLNCAAMSELVLVAFTAHLSSGWIVACTGSDK